MKRILILIMSLGLLLGMMAGCSPKAVHLGQGSIITLATTFEEAPIDAIIPESSEESSADGEESSDEGDSDSDSSEESSEESAPESKFEGGSVAVNVVTASISLDHDKVIKALKLDKYELEVEVDKNGFIVGDISTDGVKSAKELAYDYGMKASSKLSLEWFEQVENFEKWAIGKTVDELLAMKTTYIDEDRPAIPNEPDLNVSVSISVDDFLKVIEIAAKDAGWSPNKEELSHSEESSDDIDYSSFFEDSSSDLSDSGDSSSEESFGITDSAVSE